MELIHQLQIGQFFHITGEFAELELNLIKERRKAGLDSARAKGKNWW